MNTRALAEPERIQVFRLNKNTSVLFERIHAFLLSRDTCTFFSQECVCSCSTGSHVFLYNKNACILEQEYMCLLHIKNTCAFLNKNRWQEYFELRPRAFFSKFQMGCNQNYYGKMSPMAHAPPPKKKHFDRYSVYIKSSAWEYLTTVNYSLIPKKNKLLPQMH